MLAPHRTSYVVPGPGTVLEGMEASTTGLSSRPSNGLLAVVAVSYFVAAQLGFLISYGHAATSPVWPPAGVGLAAMLLLGSRVWPAILAASLITNFQVLFGRTEVDFITVLLACAGIAAGNTLQAMLGAWLTNRYANGRSAFDYPRSIFIYLGWAAVFSSLVGAVIRGLSLGASGFMPWDALSLDSLAWWLANLCSVLVVAPVILVWSRHRLPAISPARLAELGILLLLLVFACNVVFSNIIVQQTHGTLTFLLIPLLLWAALRFGRRGTATAILLFSALAIYATMGGVGPFALANRSLSLLLLQGFIATVSLMAFLVQADALERREAVSALQISEQRYRELFENNPQPMWAYDEETLDFLAVNNAALAAYGYSRLQFLRMRTPHLRPPEQAGEKSSLIETTEPQPGVEVRTQHRKADGSLIDAKVSRRTIILEGRQASLVLSTDITEKKRAERQAAAFSMLGRRLSAARTPKEAARIMVSAAEELFRWDACFFDLLDEGTERRTTVLCVDTLNGERREVPPVATHGLNPVAREAIREPKLVLRAPENQKFNEDSVPFGDKTRASASLMLVPIQNHEKVIGLLSLQSYSPNAYTEHDLQTLKALADHCAGALERIRAESENESLTAELRQRLEELRLLNEELEHRVQQRTSQLEAINKELEAFSYSVSHDLRAPLRSIRGFTEVLLERHQAQLDARGKEFLRRVCQSAQQMDTLIDDLLKLSRVGRADMQMQEIDLTGLAESIIAQLHQNEPERNVEVLISPGLKARGDERLIRVALENLLQNAWKFTGKTPNARIEVGFQPGPKGGFYIRDNGAGFEMAYAHRLFGVFQRLHTTSEFPGTGVGLATTHRIITRHGGSIWAESKPEHGATFYFTLPPDEPC